MLLSGEVFCSPMGIYMHITELESDDGLGFIPKLQVSLVSKNLIYS